MIVILPTLKRTGDELASPTRQLEILGDPRQWSGLPFADRLVGQGISELRRKRVGTLQVNVGRVCNQTCGHCHVDAGPDRRESMSETTVNQVLEFFAHSSADTLDITGGAPEMNPNFRHLVQGAVALGKSVIDRCNLTILLAKGFTDLPEFLAEHRVKVVASLPCYLEENCDAQRGDGVFLKSLQAIRTLNRLGYGQPDSGLQLDLVYNPTGWGLPPAQDQLEITYRQQLDSRYGLQFNRLYTITNMPISRFLADLLRQQQYRQYMEKLLQSFNPLTLDGLMCRDLISVDWEGYLYDCDFNQMLDLALMNANQRLHISRLTDELLVDRPIRVGNHCYGCTAGCGSSCSGTVVEVAAPKR
jgi:radical SAM/Cys-rich protein